MEHTDDEKDDGKDDVISSYFKDIKKIMDFHGRMVSAVDETVNRLPFDSSLNYALATTIAVNSQKIGKKHKKTSTKKQSETNNEISTLINDKDEIMDAMNKEIASLQTNRNAHSKTNILKELKDKLSLIDDMNEKILKLQNMKNHNDEFNDENEVCFDDMHVAQEHNTLKSEKLHESDDEKTDETFSFNIIGFGLNNPLQCASLQIMEKVNGYTVKSTLTKASNIGELRTLIYDTFNIPVINSERDKNDILMLHSHLVLNEEFGDNNTLQDAGIVDNSFILVAIKDQEKRDNVDSILDITDDDVLSINQMFNIKEKDTEELNIGQILQRLKIEKKLSLDIITQETDVEVFKMPGCGHSMTAASLYDYALSQCLNKCKILKCAHFKCTIEWQYPIIKQYLLVNIKEDMIASVMLEKERDEIREDNALRMLWNITCFCLIYSRTKDTWYRGRIDDIKGEGNDEWLVVKYGDNFKKKKEIQRKCKDIKPIPIEQDPKRFVKGCICEIFDEEKKVWFDGVIVDIFNDAEGEWLKIKYSENNTTRACDIQRYSKDIKLKIQKSAKDIKEEMERNKKYDIHYISKIKCGKLEVLLSRNVLFRNEIYSVQKCIECGVLLYRLKSNKMNAIKFSAKCRMCEKEFCWSCNKEWKSNHSCDASFRFQVLELLSKCEVKTIGSQQNVPSIRACPSCSALIYHVEACKHMDCGECKESFCFVCLLAKNRDNDEWQCGGYSDHCPKGVYQRQTNKDLPPMTYTKKFQLF